MKKKRIRILVSASSLALLVLSSSLAHADGYYLSDHHPSVTPGKDDQVYVEAPSFAEEHPKLVELTKDVIKGALAVVGISAVAKWAMGVSGAAAPVLKSVTHCMTAPGALMRHPGEGCESGPDASIQHERMVKPGDQQLSPDAPSNQGASEAAAAIPT